MTTIRRTIELDSETDARLSALAAAKGKDASAVVSDALLLLDSIVLPDEPSLEEDRRRLEEFERSGEAVPLSDVRAWVESWGSERELPRPKPAKLR